MKKIISASKQMFLSVIVLICFLSAGCAQAQNKVTTTGEAINYVGKQMTVCGMVTGTYFAMSSKGAPTFINLDKPYPDNVFTAVIWDDDRAQFTDAPEVYYKDKSICVSGTIKTYKGKAEIVVKTPSQITV